MQRSRLLTIAAAAIGVGLAVPTFAYAQSTNAMRLGDQEGIFIDGRSFSVLPGRTPQDLAGMLRMLDARALGPGAIIFRSGDRLFIAEAPIAADRYGGSRNDYGSNRYGGSRNDYGSDRFGGSRNDYGSDRFGGSRNDYGSDRFGGSRNDYGTDRFGRDSQANVERDWQEWQDSLRNGYSRSPNRFGGSRNDE
jgi:hypothetical protein